MGDVLPALQQVLTTSAADSLAPPSSGAPSSGGRASPPTRRASRSPASFLHLFEAKTCRMHTYEILI